MNLAKKDRSSSAGKVIGLTILGVIGVIVVIGMVLVGKYNSLRTEETKVDEAYANVQTVLQRRYDLIPNLVNSVKGSMKHETEVFKDIANARKEYGNASSVKDKANANAKIDKSVGTLVNVIQESYPNLTSNDNVKTLMTELEGTENRISVERRRYNETVTNYNRKVVTFPNNILANMMGLGKKTLFKADSEAQKAPTVNLE